MDEDFKNKVIKIGIGMLCAVVVVGAAEWYLKNAEKKNEAIDLLNTGAESMDKDGDPHKAIEKFTAALALEPEGEPKAFLYYNRGQAYYRLKKYGESIADLTESLRMDPKDVGALETRGNAYDEKQEHDKAIADYTEALKIEPASSSLFYNRGEAYSRKKDYGKAIADFSESIRLEPKLEPYMQRGRAYMKQREFLKATEDFEMAQRLQPNSGEALAERADAWYSLKEYAKAKTDYESALERDGNNPQVCDNYAWMLATSPRDDLRNGARAMELAVKACELSDWKKSTAIDTLAAAEAESGKWEEAVKHQKQCIGMEEGPDGDKEKVERYKARLALYETKQPFREQ